jgi:hypothetical protein
MAQACLQDSQLHDPYDVQSRLCHHRELLVGLYEVKLLRLDNVYPSAEEFQHPSIQWSA